MTDREDLNTWHLELSIVADAIGHVLHEHRGTRRACPPRPTCCSSRLDELVESCPFPAREPAMIEKHRRKKQPRAHPHFVWADPERFHVERMTAGLTQQQAAEYLGVSVRTMRNWETGSNRIPYPAFKLDQDACRGHRPCRGLGRLAICP